MTFEEYKKVAHNYVDNLNNGDALKRKIHERIDKEAKEYYDDGLEVDGLIAGFSTGLL